MSKIDDWRPLPDWAHDLYRRHLARTGHYLDAHMVKNGGRWKLRRHCCPMTPDEENWDPWDIGTRRPTKAWRDEHKGENK